MLLKTEKLTKPTTSANNDNSPTIALIGCGAIAEVFYLPALARYPSVLDNLLLIDRNEGRMRELAQNFKAKDYLVDYQDILEQGIDGVIVATPTHLHYPIAKDFLSRGIPVLCEKPLAETADKAKEMIKLAQKNGAAIVTNYQRRLYGSYLKVKELLTAGTLGEPLSIQYFEGEVFRWPTASGFYFNTKISSRGVLLDRGAHVIDLICWWLGEKPHLISSQNDSFGGREAVAHIQFEHKKCSGQVKLSLLGKLPCIFKVECERGTIEGDVFDFQNITITTHAGRKRLKLKTQEKYYTDFGHTIVANFLDVISGRANAVISGSDVLDSVKFIDECYEAATRFNMPWYQPAEAHNGR